MKRWVTAWALAAVALVAATIGLVRPAQAQPRSLEYAVKAAFLTKFGAFVSWPSGTPRPLQLCIVGDDPFGGSLEQAARNQALVIRRMAAVERETGCDVVYAAGSGRQSAAQALATVQGTPVLTVTDSARGPAKGMIHFVIFEDRVRFQVDAAQAARGGITLSSKLLTLALSVKR